MSPVGKNADDTKMITKVRGNIAWVASLEPVRIATARLNPPIATARKAAMTINARAATTPPCTGAPNTVKISTRTVARMAENTIAPARRPMKTARRLVGELIKRSKKPFWISVAMPVPASPALNDTP